MTVDEMIECLQELSNEGYGNTNVEMTIVDSNGEQFNVSELSFCVYDQKNLTLDLRNWNEYDTTVHFAL